MPSVRPRSKSGVTLIEVMLAGSLLALAVLSLFEGIAVCSRAAHENAQFLVADAYAHDLAWKRCNEKYAALYALYQKRGNAAIVETLPQDAVPKLWRADAPPTARTTLSLPRSAGGGVDASGLVITVDVEWGAQDRRLRLAPSHVACAFARKEDS